MRLKATALETSKAMESVQQTDGPSTMPYVDMAADGVHPLTALCVRIVQDVCGCVWRERRFRQ